MASLEKALEMRMRAHEVHTSNVANANVPNFKAKKIDFDARIAQALEGLEQKDGTLLERETVSTQKLAQVTADVYADPLAKANGDGNTVNMEREQAEIAKNTIGYEAAIQMISKKFALAKYVLGDGGR